MHPLAVEPHSDWALVLLALIPAIPSIITAALSMRNHRKLRDVNHAVRENAQASTLLAANVKEACLNGAHMRIKKGK